MASLWRALTGMFTNQRTTPRELQQRLDTYRLAILTSYRLTGQRSRITADKMQAHHDDYAQVLQENLTTQTQALLQLCGPPLSEAGPKEAAQAPTLRLAAAARRLQERVGFSLDVRRSVVEGEFDKRWVMPLPRTHIRMSSCPLARLFARCCAVHRRGWAGSFREGACSPRFGDCFLARNILRGTVHRVDSWFPGGTMLCWSHWAAWFARVLKCTNRTYGSHTTTMTF